MMVGREYLRFFNREKRRDSFFSKVILKIFMVLSFQKKQIEVT